MGQGESKRQEKPVVELPLVNKKYKMFSCLGQGNFGGVYKVQEKKSKKFYAMKCVPVDAQPGTNKNQQEVVYQTALTEKDLLSKFDHPHIVKLVESFVIGYNPACKPPKKQKKSNKNLPEEKNRWFCLILEYVQGNTLEKIIRRIEDYKAKVESGVAESGEDFLVPVDVCLKWFIKLLETVNHIAEKNIIHCDLHLENILLSFDDMKDYRAIDLKISDFGCAKDLSTGVKPRDLSGQIFYSATECVNQLEYDTSADVWSLGICFMNIYSQTSMANYIKQVEKVFFRIKTDPVVRQKLLDRYKIKNPMAVHSLPYITLINFMHEEKLFDEVIRNVIDDAAVRSLLFSMVCPVEKRFSAKQLLETKTIRTWRYLMDRKSENDENIGKDINLEDIDLSALITIMKIPDDEYLMVRCLKVLKLCILKNDTLAFIKDGGVFEMFEYMQNLQKTLIVKQFLQLFGSSSESESLNLDRKIDLFEPMFADIVTIATTCYFFVKNRNSEEDKTLLENVVLTMVQSVREFTCIPPLLNLLNKFPDNECFYYFTLLLLSNSRTIRATLCTKKNIKNLITNINKKNEVYTKAILSTLMSEMNIELLDFVLENYGSKNDLTFFKNCKFKNHIFKSVLKPLFSEILLGDNQEEKYIVEILLNIIFIVQNFDPESKIQKMKLHLKSIPSSSNHLEFGRGFKKLDAKVDIKGLEWELKTRKLEAGGKRIELISTEPVVKFQKISENVEEICIGYYDISVLNGGFKDDLIFGLHAAGLKGCSLYLDSKTGTIEIMECGKKKEEMKEIKIVVPEAITICESGIIVGCGLTNKGRVFFTKNNQVLQDSEKRYIFNTLFPENTNSEVSLKASILMNENKGFKGKINFGKVYVPPVDPNLKKKKSQKKNEEKIQPFEFKFCEILPKEMNSQVVKGGYNEYYGINQDVVEFMKKEVSDNGEILKHVKEMFSSSEIVMKLVKKIENFMSPDGETCRSESPISNDELSKLFMEISYAEKIATPFYMKSEVYNKECGNLEDETEGEGDAFVDF